MLNNEELLKNTDIQKIADDGKKIYEQIRDQYDPEKKGKFLAIEVESGNTYLGSSSVEALNLAKKNHPNKIFYVIKIGYDVAETMAKSFIEKE